MKKTFKIAIVTVLVLLAGGAGSIYYFLNVKEYDVSDAKVEEITKADYQIDLPDADDAVDDKDSGAAGEGGEEAAGEESQVANEDSVETSTTSTNGNTESKQKEKARESASGSKKSRADDTENTENSAKDKKKQAVTAESIKAAYRPVFQSLEAQANAKIDSLVSAAYSEYQTKKENGESVSVTYFYRKYSAAGKELESMTDQTFQYVYESLENELTKQGFSAKEAHEFKTQYENAKSAREAALIEKAKAAM